MSRVWDMLQRWDREARVEGAGDGRAIAVVMVASLSLLLLHFVVLSRSIQASLGVAIVRGLFDLTGVDLMPYEPLVEGAVWSTGCGFFYVLLPATVIRVFWREPLSAYGFTVHGYFEHIWWYVALFLPVGLLVLLVSLQPAFQERYPFYDEVRGIPDFIVWEFFYGIQFLYLEFFFRGFLIHGLKQRLGIYSVFLMITPYMMIHFGKPVLEATGAIVAGTILGFLSLRTGSIFGGATIHVMVAVSMDLMALYRKGFFG
jgi:membrane protease YdiL (CAAX protease family)